MLTVGVTETVPLSPGEKVREQEGTQVPGVFGPFRETVGHVEPSPQLTFPCPATKLLLHEIPTVTVNPT
jgi:hypothetical protein